VKSWVFDKSWWGIVTNACKMRCENLVAKGLDLGWVLAGFSFCALVAKLVKK